MVISFKARLRFGTAIGCLMLAAPVWAETAAQTDGSVGVEDIVVTARSRGEKAGSNEASVDLMAGSRFSTSFRTSPLPRKKSAS